MTHLSGTHLHSLRSSVRAKDGFHKQNLSMHCFAFHCVT
ncbi:Uncharacterised protein [Vibrio cholerae]|nr:Uncharacterised protein [Vibrio cholerae]